MDDMLALDGGSAARNWQKRHLKRKQREEKTHLAALMREEAKADLRKRTAKWRERWKAKAAANKAAGLPPPTKHGRPRDMKRKQWVDLAGQRFGRQTVIRIAPITKSRGRNRRWWVRCDCGSGDRLVAGTNLRQGITLSCGCLRNEAVKENWRSGKLAKRQQQRARDRERPVDWHLVRLRRQFSAGSKEAKLITKARKLIVAYELQLGIRKPRNQKANQSRRTTIH